MQQQSYNTALLRQRGSIIVLFSIVLITLLGVLGLAVDAGTLYRARLALQNAADATALGTVSHVATTGYMRAKAQAGAEALTDDAAIAAKMTLYLAPQAAQLARANAAQAGLPHDPDSGFPVNVGRAEYLPPGHPETRPGAAFAYAVQLERPVELHLMDLIPGFNVRDGLVRVQAVSQRELANAALVLDLSASMKCPASGPCTCLNPDRQAECPGSGRRYDALIDGVKEFLKLFDLERDQISIVPFNLAAAGSSLDELIAEFNLQPPMTLQKVEVLAELLKAKYQPESATNICDGLMEAFAEMDRLARDRKASYLFFSDGAPTAARLLFTAATAQPSLEPHSLGFGAFDYTSYVVEWVRSSQSVVPQLPARYYAGPSLLLNSSSVKSADPGQLGIPLADPSAPPRPAGEPACKDGLSAAPNINAPSDLRPASQQVFAPCLDSLQAHMPGDETWQYGGNYQRGPGSAPGFHNWREQYYHCAIELSDFIRSKNGTVYAIGLGELQQGVNPLDPYQDIDDNFHRKDIFLSRVALDLNEARRFTFVDSQGETVYVEFDYDGYRQYASVSPDTVEHQAGAYLPTHDAGQLRLLFSKIAREVLLKLIS